MAKALSLLQRLWNFRQRDEPKDSAFEQRLQEMGGLRQVSVARAVLFRTGQ
ncbi:hypothetical protein Q9295_13795 [Xinfangfangia sp. CPCC 101601]|uniref:Uncharacterized protein n=1 Tax=Pseudogemmobacter lacusdianii TaxID=3069608 RepID=A0ABU0W0B0_9RHOB|nr:hypothetical protein [Xinfangfangia sp. CPCC 101601]MDQ2067447.1 hypothetical protein [Xinfangfangia sp. CPCC 101601]